MACQRPTATRRRQEERDQLGQDEEAKQQEGWAAGLCLRGGARRAPGEGPEAAGPRATAGASTDGVVCRRRRTLPRLPRARVLRAGRRLGEVGGAGVAGAGGGRVRDLPRRSGGRGRRGWL